MSIYNAMGKTIKWMLEIDILRNFSQRILGVLKGDFYGVGCPNSAQTPCWLRLGAKPTLVSVGMTGAKRHNWCQSYLHSFTVCTLQYCEVKTKQFLFMHHQIIRPILASMEVKNSGPIYNAILVIIGCFECISVFLRLYSRTKSQTTFS